MGGLRVAADRVNPSLFYASGRDITEHQQPIRLLRDVLGQAFQDGLQCVVPEGRAG